MCPVVLGDFGADGRLGFVVHFANHLVAEPVAPVFERARRNPVEQPGFGVGDVFAVNVIRVGLPVEPAELDGLTGTLGDFTGDDFLVEHDEAKHVHEARAPGVIAAEPDVAVEPGDAVVVFEDPVPERLKAGRVVAIEVNVRHPCDHLRLPGERLFDEFGDDVLDLVHVERADPLTGFLPCAIPGEPAVIGVLPSGVLRVVHVFDPMILNALHFHHVLAQILDAAWERLVNHRLGERVEHGEVQRAIEAERVARLVVLCLEPGALFVKRDERFLVAGGEAVPGDAEDRNIAHDHNAAGIKNKIQAANRTG